VDLTHTRFSPTGCPDGRSFCSASSLVIAFVPMLLRLLRHIWPNSGFSSARFGFRLQAPLPPCPERQGGSASTSTSGSGSSCSVHHQGSSSLESSSSGILHRELLVIILIIPELAGPRSSKKDSSSSSSKFPLGQSSGSDFGSVLIRFQFGFEFRFEFQFFFENLLRIFILAIICSGSSPVLLLFLSIQFLRGSR